MSKRYVEAMRKRLVTLKGMAYKAMDRAKSEEAQRAAIYVLFRLDNVEPKLFALDHFTDRDDKAADDQVKATPK